MEGREGTGGKGRKGKPSHFSKLCDGYGWSPFKYNLRWPMQSIETLVASVPHSSSNHRYHETPRNSNPTSGMNNKEMRELTWS